MGWLTHGTSAPPAVPSYYPTTTQWQRAGLYFDGQEMGVTLSQAGADSYRVVDGITGDVVKTGVISGTSVDVGTAGTAPFDKYGSWRVELTGPNTDANYGTSYGACWVHHLPVDSRFPNNPSVSTPNVPAGDFTPGDPYTRGVLGVGPQRLQIHHADDPTNSTYLTPGGASISIAQNYAAQEAAYYTDFNPDPVRPRASFLSFPNGAWDRISNLTDSSSSGGVIFCKDETIDGSKVWCQSVPGTSSGVKLTVRYPDSTTIVETYDNQVLQSDLVAATASSAFIKYFARKPANAAPTFALTKIGNTFSAGVTATVAACYPSGITHYEGPRNEPTLSTGPELAHALKLFRVAVKAGNAGAKVLGPEFVSFDNQSGGINVLAAMFSAGETNYLDNPSSHGYNDTDLGDIPSMRQLIGAFAAVMNSHGYYSWWQSECSVNTPTYGVMHARRGVNWQMLMVLALEQYGCPKEQTHFWYDVSHGFWSQPAFFITENQDVFPQAIVYRALSAELYGKAFSGAINFPGPYNDHLLGSLYRNPDTLDRTMVLISEIGSSIPIVFKVYGSPNLTAVDWAGNKFSVPIIGGKARITVTDMPVYLRLPAGTNIGPVSPVVCAGGVGPNLAPSATPTSTGIATRITRINDGINTNGYGATLAPYNDTAGMPGAVTLTWLATQTFNHVIVRCPPPWQANSTLLDFDLQTSVDGSTWVTVATVTKTAPNVYHHASHAEGIIVTSWWDEQHLFDFFFDAPLAGIKAVRVNVRATSYGGEPTADAVAQGGQGATTQQMAITDIWISNDVADVDTAPTYLLRHGAFT